MKQNVCVPSYFKDLPDDANLNSRDIAEIFDIMASSVTTAYKHNRIPQPDWVKAYPKTGNHNYWKVKTIREWIENNQ